MEGTNPMDSIKIGDKLQIHCYKHNGKIHRSWDEAVVLDIKDDYIVCGNNKAMVIESDGKTHRTKEPAIIYFYKYRWFNVIGQLKSNGIFYYCNIASPYLIDNKTIKYIDYDLDLRVFPDGGFKILDRSEYNYHKKKMHYSDDIDMIVQSELTSLINMVRLKQDGFEKDKIEYYYSIYKEYSLKK